MTRGWHRTLNAWLRAMPDDLSLADPWLAYWRGVALVPFDAAATHAHLERADRQFVAAARSKGAYLAWIANIELICLE